MNSERSSTPFREGYSLTHPFGQREKVIGLEFGGGAERLDETIEKALKKRDFSVRFSSALEYRYETDRAAERSREIVNSGIAAVVMFNLFLIADHMLLPDVFKTILTLRLAFVTPLTLLAIVIVRGRPKPAVSETMGLLIALVVTASLVYGFAISRSHLAGYYQFGLILVLVFSNVVLQLRFRYALVSSALQVTIYAAAVIASPLLPRPVKATAVVLACLGALFTLFANWRLERNERKAYLLSLRDRELGFELAAQNRRLQELSSSDPLTGVANRRLFDERIVKIWERSLVDGRAVGMLMVDVDHFKAYNDLYGHLRGDDCLRRIAGALGTEIRLNTDVLARYGGEEFVAVLPGLDRDGCLGVAERMRAAVFALSLRHDGAEGTGRVTVSIGVAARPAEQSLTVTQLLVEADAALYEAKREGRNRVRAAGAPVESDKSA